MEPTNDKPVKRNRGGQPCNKNRLKHGIYSEHISVQDDEQLGSMAHDKSEHELALARVRLKQCMAKQDSAPPEEWLRYEKAIAHYLAVIVNLTNRNALLGRDSKTAFVTVMEMIRQVNEQQHVK